MMLHRNNAFQNPSVSSMFQKCSLLPEHFSRFLWFSVHMLKQEKWCKPYVVFLRSCLFERWSLCVILCAVYMCSKSAYSGSLVSIPEQNHCYIRFKNGWKPGLRPKICFEGKSAWWLQYENSRTKVNEVVEVVENSIVEKVCTNSKKDKAWSILPGSRAHIFVFLWKGFRAYGLVDLHFNLQHHVIQMSDLSSGEIIGEIIGLCKWVLRFCVAKDLDFVDETDTQSDRHPPQEGSISSMPSSGSLSPCVRPVTRSIVLIVPAKTIARIFLGVSNSSSPATDDTNLWSSFVSSVDSDCVSSHQCCH
jgi:hypothetical protein